MENIKKDNILYYVFDGTLEGLFTCVFDAFERKEMPLLILREENQTLFAEYYRVITDKQRADRVLNGLKKKISKSAVNMLFICWLTELKEVDMYIFNYICKAFTSPSSIELNFADNDVLELKKIFQKVRWEAEHLRQFLRFQKTSEQIYFAMVEPLYDVLLMTREFFQDRFADQQWIIYDIKRHFGLYYDLNKTEIVYFDDLKVNKSTGKISKELLSSDEFDFQKGWKEYLKSITIKERIKVKLQKQHMPVRFWKYLTEKQG